MIKKLLLTTVALANVVGVTPAAADFYIELADGRYLVIPDLFAFMVAVSAIGGVLMIIASSSSSGRGGSDLPSEIDTPEPAEYYEDQASRARALKRNLDAETELAESYINAKRTRAELDEIEEILGHDKAKRRR